jgi:hypothetical protein
VPKHFLWIKAAHKHFDEILTSGETTYWTATKRAIFYGTTAIVIYTDGRRDYVFGATHPRSGQSEVALGSTSLGLLRGSETKAHEFYDNNKTKLSIHNAPYQKAVMGRDVNNIVTVEFTFV